MLSVTGLKMFLELKMDQGPQVFVPFDYDMTSSTTITSIRAAFGHIFFATQVCRTLPPVSGSNVHLYIIDKISFGHMLN
jgi:hypothetical protein